MPTNPIGPPGTMGSSRLPPTRLDRLTAVGSNRLNSNNFPRDARNRTSTTYAQVLLSNQVITAPVTGTSFYVIACNGEVEIQPSGGAYNTYVQGTGLSLATIENAFDQLQLRNPNAFPIAVLIFVGFDEYIDKRLYLDTINTPIVAYPTYPLANAAPAVNIVDISGSQFADINGNQWYALSRVSVIISNIDTGVTLLLQQAASIIANGPAVAAIYPTTSLRFDAAGDYVLHLGGANINAIVCELYRSISAEQ